MRLCNTVIVLAKFSLELNYHNPNHDNAFDYVLIPSVTHIFSLRLQHEQIANTAFKKYSSEEK